MISELLQAGRKQYEIARALGRSGVHDQPGDHPRDEQARLLHRLDRTGLDPGSWTR
ncbi:hypothetical protein G6038_08705 [Rhodococcus sp. 14C212]|nr:hypothetical protein [Rhodococcus sp. 14C212]